MPPRTVHFQNNLIKTISYREYTAKTVYPHFCINENHNLENYQVGFCPVLCLFDIRGGHSPLCSRIFHSTYVYPLLPTSRQWREYDIIGYRLKKYLLICLLLSWQVKINVFYYIMVLITMPFRKRQNRIWKAGNRKWGQAPLASKQQRTCSFGPVALGREKALKSILRRL